MSNPFAFFCGLAVFAVSASAELIPAARLTDWTPGNRVGVIGGIPANRTHLIDVTLAPYNADKTGATDTRAAIQAAIDAAVAGDVVYLPAGTYRIDSGLVLGANFSGKTLRGAGPGLTIIDQRANGGIAVGSASGFGVPLAPQTYAPGPPALVTAGLSKGSSTVTVDHLNFLQGSGASGFAVGQIILFNVQNDETLPVVSVYNYDVFTNMAPTSQLVRVTAVNPAAKTVTFFPPLFDAYGGGSLQVRVLYAVFQASSIGLEDLTIDATNYTAGGGAFNCVQFNNCFGSWVKNCTIRKAKNYNLYFQDSLNCEVRHCTLSGSQLSGTNGSGLLFNRSCSSLVEDNIILDSWPLIEVNFGSSGNVFAYNYSSNGMWNTNHGPHNQFNLYEGNAGGYQMSDGYFGSEANLTIFRNYWHDSVIKSGVNLRRWTRNASVVGNMFQTQFGADGLPNMGNGDFTGTAQLSAGAPWRDWQMSGTLSTRTDDTNGVITLTTTGRLYPPTPYTTQIVGLIWGAGKDHRAGASVTASTGSGGVGATATILRTSGESLPAQGTTVYIGPGAFYDGHDYASYQEKDLDVAATTVKKGNRYADTNDFDSLGGDTLPDSLFRLSKPSWFNNLAWPPYDPVTPRTPSIEDIPAGYRHVNRVDPGGGAGDMSPPTVPANLVAAANGSTRIDLSWNVSTDNVAVTGYRVERAQGVGSTIYIPVGSPTEISYIDTGLAAATVYNYRVRAVDAAGNSSGYSNVTTVETSSGPTDMTPPSVPLNFTAVANGATLINLNWNASTDNVGVVGYRVERSQGAGSTTYTEVAPPTGAGNSDSGLTPGTVYNYRVRAVDAAGNFSGFSSVATASTGNLTDTTPPTVPSNMAAVVSGPTQINVTWVACTDNVGVTGYLVERSHGVGSTTYAQIGTAAAVNYSNTGLTTGTVYNYRVRAVDAAGNTSGYSNAVSATTTAATNSNGLVAAYGFDEISGIAVTDASGNGNTGTINGASRTTMGRNGRALSFNGVDNIVLVNNSPSLSLSSAMTLEAWIYPTASQSGWRAILHKETDAWYLHSCNPNGDMLPAGGAIVAGWEQYTAGPNALSLNGWTHLATTYDGVTLRLYVNGREVSNQAMTGAIEVNSNPLRIGGNTYASQFFQGRIDDVRIYNRALTPGEIQMDMSAAVGAPQAPRRLRLAVP